MDGSRAFKTKRRGWFYFATVLVNTHALAINIAHVSYHSIGTLEGANRDMEIQLAPLLSCTHQLHPNVISPYESLGPSYLPFAKHTTGFQSSKCHSAKQKQKQTKIPQCSQDVCRITLYFAQAAISFHSLHPLTHLADRCHAGPLSLF